jgi:hypothetical protein
MNSKVLTRSTAGIALAALLFAPCISDTAVLAQAAPSPAPAQATRTPGTSGGFDPAATPAPTPAATISEVLVQGGTSVHVSLAEPLSSGSAHQGDIVGILVTKDVGANGMLIVKKGANGQATVTEVQGAGGNGSGGKLALSIDWIYSLDGGKIALSSVNHATESGDTKGAASTATIATYLLLGPLGLFAHNFVRGKNVTIPTDRVFDVFVDHDVHVNSNQPYGADPGFDK